MMCAEDKYEERKTCKDVPPAPKCVEQGDKCTYNQKCCGDNLICSADGIGGEMTCKEKPPKCTNILPSEQKCIAEGGLVKGDKCDSTNGHKCCGKTMYCCFKDWICKDRREEASSRSKQAMRYNKAKENHHFDNGDKSVFLKVSLS